MTKEDEKGGFSKFLHSLDRSAIYTVCGIILLFSVSIIFVLVAPSHVDETWTSPSSSFQVQMYEHVDPNYYLSTGSSNGEKVVYVHHIKEGENVLAFQEDDHLTIEAPKELEKYVTKKGEQELKLTSRMLLLRPSTQENKLKESELPSDTLVLELYDPKKSEVFAIDFTESLLPEWIEDHYTLLDGENKFQNPVERGLTYIKNPQEFLVKMGERDKKWSYDPSGVPVKDLSELISPQLGFYSRKSLIEMGEQIYAIEGCWYCHTDQTRTLIEDTVLNGSESFPAPPSTANEFIYQKVTFPGTRRIGPDLSRVGVKRPSRIWHIEHFAAPRMVVPGSVMPVFSHFFTFAAEGEAGIPITSNKKVVPNVQFEAVYQYMMTKGTRITSPLQAWWLGKDPLQTKQIIDSD